MLWIKLVKLTWLELWQSAVYRILLVLSLIAPLFGVVMGALFMVDIGKVYMDSIAAVSELIALVFIIFVVVALLGQDIFQKVCYVLLTPPVQRKDYFLGRFVGVMLGFVLLLMLLFASSWLIALLYILQKPVFFQSGFDAVNLAQLFFFHYFQYVSLLGVVFFIASCSSGEHEAMLFSVAMLIFTWVFPPVLQAMNNPEVVAETPSFIMQILQLIYDILPHLYGSDLSLRLAHGMSIGWQAGAFYVLEHVLYGVVSFLLGLLVFQRRDL